MNKKKDHRQCWKVQNLLSCNLEVLEFSNREKSYGYDVSAHECLYQAECNFHHHPSERFKYGFRYSIEVMQNSPVFAASHGIIAQQHRWFCQCCGILI